MHTRSGRVKTIIIILFGTLLLGISSANGLRVSFGVGIPSEGAVPLTVRAAYPIATVHNKDSAISFLARLDIITTTAFSSAPTVALNALVSPQVSGVAPYFGAGVGVNAIALPDSQVFMLYGQFIAGLRISIYEQLSTSIELQLATSALSTNQQLILALEYSFGAE